MNKEVTEIRDLTLTLNELKAKKNEIKKKLQEHRDTFTDSLADEKIGEVAEINERIAKVENLIKEAQDRADENNKNIKRSEKIMESILEKRSTIEYRKAFMEYIQRGTTSEILETRSDAVTTTTTAATVIPTTIFDELLKIDRAEGKILAKVRKLNIKGGVRVPSIVAAPTATWIDETTTSDRKALTTTSISFSYYGLEVKIAQTLLSEYTSVEEFERQFAVLAANAMINAKEIAIFNGTGSGQPTGILTSTAVTTIVNSTAANFAKWQTLVDIVGKLPVKYRARAEWVMAQGTWDKVVGMVDSDGQPIARVNYGISGGAVLSLLGYTVNIVDEDRIKSISLATAGTDYIVVFGDLSKYAINSNGNLGVYRYRDEENNVDVTKALEFVDGNVLDGKAFVKVKLVTA